jgi:hypothetical protein
MVNPAATDAEDTADYKVRLKKFSPQRTRGGQRVTQTARIFSRGKETRCCRADGATVSVNGSTGNDEISAREAQIEL